jgi:membrane associated rhomboid family serine protease
MIPLRDINRSRTTPYVTWAIIALNVLVFLYQLTLGPRGTMRFYLQYGVIPYELTHGVDLPPPAGVQPLYLTVLTAMFIHGGLLHLAGNMVYLWVFGDNVEDRMGHLRFLIFYFLCGIAATAAQVLVNPNSRVPNIGASGAIAGVLGAYLVLFPAAQIETLAFWGFFIGIVRIPALVLLGYWILIQFVSGIVTLGMPQTGGGVAWFAHIGGFIAGMALVKIFARRRPPPPAWEYYSPRW